MPSLTLIINTYEQPDYLARVLAAVSTQASLPDEVLVAEDGTGEETWRVFERWSKPPGINAEHVRQNHEGFRRARILNQAISPARSEYIVFLDGATVPHPDFVSDHRQLARQGAFIQGHRALVKQQAAAWFGQGSFA